MYSTSSKKGPQISIASRPCSCVRAGLHKRLENPKKGRNVNNLAEEMLCLVGRVDVGKMAPFKDLNVLGDFADGNEN